MQVRLYLNCSSIFQLQHFSSTPILNIASIFTCTFILFQTATQHNFPPNLNMNLNSDALRGSGIRSKRSEGNIHKHITEIKVRSVLLLLYVRHYMLLELCSNIQ